MPRNPRVKLLPAGPYIEIDGGSLYLGRDCHLARHMPALLSKVVSSRHCCVRDDGVDHWTLEDLGSTNGTWLRGQRLTEPGPLESGDIFSMGRAGPQFQWEPAETLETARPDLRGRREGGATLLEEPDGSAERPYRVGRTPEVALRHERTGGLYAASGYTIVLGRNPSVAIVIRSDEERHVSGRHAEIQFRSDGGVVVRDLGSKNGTWLNDRPLRREAPLHVGDRLVLGAAPTALSVMKLQGSQPNDG